LIPVLGNCSGFRSDIAGAFGLCDHGESGVRTYWQTMFTILAIILVLLLIGALPTWPHSSGWGYYPAGGLGLILVILLVLFLMGRV
ncbi:MAG TPA: DUF3309 family protein, partial [Chthoniobacteraceae bacterium]|nr:DUF3309 family protein [Chthoniobacteraceae bacterium]